MNQALKLHSHDTATPPTPSLTDAFVNKRMVVFFSGMRCETAEFPLSVQVNIVPVRGSIQFEAAPIGPSLQPEVSRQRARERETALYDAVIR